MTGAHIVMLIVAACVLYLAAAFALGRVLRRRGGGR